jgi:sugar lactone lactonase YvrE
MMSPATPTVLVDGLSFPESPRWRDGALWFSDLVLRAVFSVDEAGVLTKVAGVPGRPSGLGWLPDGRLLVVSMEDRTLLRQRPDTAAMELQPFADLSALAHSYCNDMLVDEAGRAYVGNFGFDAGAGEPVRATVLVRVDPDGDARVVADDLLFPNGMALTADRRLIVAETAGDRLTSFAARDDGGLHDRRTFAALPGLAPDGICLDAEGAVWVAAAGTGEVVRVAEGGDVLARVSPPSGRAFACALGGADGRTLFICAAAGVPRPEETGGRREGLIVRTRVDVPGA